MSANNIIVTIDRQYGSGGHIIGMKLAEARSCCNKAKEQSEFLS